MNKTRPEAADFTRALVRRFADVSRPPTVNREPSAGRPPNSGCEIAIFPPFTAIDAVSTAAGDAVTVGAQDVFYEQSGAYTGEISCEMLKDAGCSMVITGHSERRRIFGESDKTVAAKTKAAADGGLTALLCVGETAEQREGGGAADTVRRQIEAAAAGVLPQNLTVAYEPVWAIGTGKNARTVEIEEMHENIRGVLTAVFGAAGEGVRILYGGSVNAGNAREIAGAAGVDGMLVGGAGLEIEAFAGIIEAILAV